MPNQFLIRLPCLTVLAPFRRRFCLQMSESRRRLVGAPAAFLAVVSALRRRGSALYSQKIAVFRTLNHDAEIMHGAKL